MSQTDKNGQNNQSAKDRKAYEDAQRERDSQARQNQLNAHRAQLQQQMHMRSDYHRLGFTHKLVIFVILTLKISFVLLLLASHIPQTKEFAFQLMKLFL